MGPYIVAGVLAVIVGLIIYSLIRKHKRGKSIMCDCSCCDKQCPMSKKE